MKSTLVFAPFPAAPLPRWPPMFLGHYGVAFALKRAEPKLSLGTLFVAVQLPDLLWGIFMLLGWEHARIVPGYTAVTPLEFLDYPISHSLVGALAWSMVAAALYYSWPTRDTSRHWQAAAIVGLAVFSHYPLDVLVHLPDLPLMGNDSPSSGSASGTIRLPRWPWRLLVFGGGLALYVARGSTGTRSEWSRLLVVRCPAGRHLPGKLVRAASTQHDDRGGERYRSHPGHGCPGRVGRPAGQPTRSWPLEDCRTGDEDGSAVFRRWARCPPWLVAAGAFGAHALRTRLTPEYLAVFETAARYQMYHALGLLAVAWAVTRWPGAVTSLGGVAVRGGNRALLRQSLHSGAHRDPLARGHHAAGWSWPSWRLALSRCGRH